jgi:hypothetical protein
MVAIATAINIATSAWIANSSNKLLPKRNIQLSKIQFQAVIAQILKTALM